MPSFCVNTARCADFTRIRCRRLVAIARLQLGTNSVSALSSSAAPGIYCTRYDPTSPSLNLKRLIATTKGIYTCRATFNGDSDPCKSALVAQDGVYPYNLSCCVSWERACNAFLFYQVTLPAASHCFLQGKKTCKISLPNPPPRSILSSSAPVSSVPQYPITWQGWGNPAL